VAERASVQEWTLRCKNQEAGQAEERAGKFLQKREFACFATPQIAALAATQQVGQNIRDRDHKGDPMNLTMNRSVLVEAFGANEGAALRLKQVALFVLGIALIALAAKIKVPVPGSPVAMNLGTLAVLTIGAAYGARLGLATIMGYMVLGMIGFDIFQSSTAELNGIGYMMGSTGGYLVGYVLAVVALGALARAGWDRSVIRMAAAMLVGNVLIYVPGLIWLAVLYGVDQPILAWGLTPFLLGDALKLALAAGLLPLAWKLVGRARG
jgi:biotin transport system substrate-specific component